MFKVLVDAGALQLAINVLERAGKKEVVEELRKATTPNYGKVQFGVRVPAQYTDVYWGLSFTKLKEVDIGPAYSLVMRDADKSTNQGRLESMFKTLAKLEQLEIIRLDMPDEFVQQIGDSHMEFTTVRNYDETFGDNILMSYLRFKAEQKSPDFADKYHREYYNTWPTSKPGE